MDAERKRVLTRQTISGAAAAGMFRVDFTIYGPDDERLHRLTGMVGTRRLHSIAPGDTLDRLGIKRGHYRQLRRDDGFVRQLGVGPVKV